MYLGTLNYENCDAIAITTFPQSSHNEINKLSTTLSRFIVKKGNFQYIVDNTMLTNYHTLRYVASTLHSILPGTTVSQLYSQERDELTVTFSGGSVHNLIVSCRADSNICYLHRSIARARRNTVDVLPACQGALVSGVTILPADRIIHIALSGSRILVLQFFGVKANVFLVNDVGVIEDSFRTPREYRGKEYTTRAGEGVYDFTRLASSTGIQGTGLLAAVLKNLYPSLGATLIHEALFRSNLDISTNASTVDRALCHTVANNLQRILEETGHPLPRIYLTDEGEPALFSIVPLRFAEQYEERCFDDIHEAIRFFLSRRRKANAFTAEQAEIRTTIEQRVEKAQRAIAAAERDLHESNRAEEYEQAGAALLSNPQNFPRGTCTVELQSPGGMISIPLDPSLSQTQNAQQYFSRAKRARLSRKQAEGRIIGLRRTLATANYLFPLLEAVNTRGELKTLMSTHLDQFAVFGFGANNEEQKHLPFRIFTVDGGFEVWAGKNSVSNDLLTMRHAKPNDLWFHARGSSGSHVILKIGTAKGTPGKRAKEQAAGIAAYYSRMRHARTVPVAMTERKYVRKPKGAPPGTVVLDREQTIFADPVLPSDAGHHHN
jgi:predicted ribosome quality control (RQC) complex YloA/Tae2 family protein